VTITDAELTRDAAARGFRTEVLEKVIKLLELLDSLRKHPFLEPRIALKGGTALKADPDEVGRLLVPMLRGDLAPTRDHIRTWTERLVADCRDLLSAVLPLEPREREFLDRLNDGADIAAELLTDDAGLQGVIRAHPALLWKALNVKKHLGASDRDRT